LDKSKEKTFKEINLEFESELNNIKKIFEKFNIDYAELKDNKLTLDLKKVDYNFIKYLQNNLRLYGKLIERG
jgi:hypothetical protein